MKMHGLASKKALNPGHRGLRPGLVRLGAPVMSMLLLFAGCHAGRRSGGPTLLERISRVGHGKGQPPASGELAERGRAAIREECAKQSYENARKGLIVSETGLHEDVFALRDRVSYGATGYGLDEALRLESMLETNGANGRGLPAEQALCIREFSEHLEALTDPLVEADERQKELNVSAFENATKEAQEQADKKLRDPETPVSPKTQPATSP